MPPSPSRRAATTAPRSDERGKQSSKHRSKGTAHGQNYLRDTASSSSRNIVRDSWSDTPSRKRQGSHENVSKDKKHHPDASIPSNVNNPPADANGGAARRREKPNEPANVNNNINQNDNTNSNVEVTDMEILLNEGASIPDEAARHVYFRCRNKSDPLALKRLNSFAKGDELTRILGGPYEWHRSTPAGPILICCKDATQVTKLLGIDNFLGVTIDSEIAYNINTVQGVISDPSICDMPVELILEKLKDQHVVNVRPIFKGTESDRTRSNYIVISFRLRKLPRRIFLGRERHNITPYRTYAMQCTNCWWFGHKAERCNRSRTCKHCCKTGDRNHDYETCAIANTEIRCKNCKGNHTPDNKDCPVWFKQSSIAKIRTNYQVSFKRAVVIFNKKFKLDNATNNISNNVNNPFETPRSAGRRGSDRAAPYVALTPTGPQPSNYSEAARAQPRGRYDVLQDMTDMTNAPEDNTISPIIGTSSRAQNNMRTPKSGVRQKSHYVPASARFSSSEDELEQYLVSPRKRVSKRSKDAHAHPPKTVPEQSANNSEAEPEILSQVLPRYIPKNRTHQLPKPLKPDNSSGNKPGNGNPKPTPLPTDFFKACTSLDPLMLLQAVFKILLAIPELLKCTQGKNFESQFAVLTNLIKDVFINITTSQDGGNRAPHE